MESTSGIEKTEFEKLNPKFIFSKNKIKLDIGGKVFVTGKSTLTNDKSKFFTTMFSGRWSIPTEEDGSIFIDRDPSAFHHVLNFLRGEEIFPEEITEKERIRLLKDAEFYEIDELRNFLKSDAFPNSSLNSTTFDRFCLRPSNLFSSDGFSTDNSSHFCWRWITDANSNRRRALTIEPGPEEQVMLKYVISPTDLSGVNGYATDLDNNFAFNYRDIRTDSGVDQKVVIIEASVEKAPALYEKKVFPHNLRGVNSYQEDCNFRFCWRWARTSTGESVRMVTLES